MKKIGAVSGKFRILHNAHKEYILKATLYVDVLHVFIVDDPTIERYSSVGETKKAIIQMLKGIEIEYYIHIAPKIDSMLEWDEYVIKLLGTTKVVMFNSKEEYSNVKLQTGYINCQHALSISASEIEKNPYLEHNFKNIASEYRPFLNYKIAISGIENCGKTQMIRKIAKIYQTAASEDMYKNYLEHNFNNENTELTLREYGKICAEQQISNEQANKKANRFVIIDNDYAMLLNKLLTIKTKYNSSEFEIIKKQIEFNWQLNRNDLTLVIKPKQINEQYQQLIEIYEENKVNYIEIEINDYQKMFAEIEKKIYKLLKIND